MLRALGVGTLDELVGRDGPRATSASRATLDLPARRRRGGACWRELRALAGQEPDLAVVHRHGLLRLHHAAGHPAQHPGEPGLVHGVHAVPGRDRAGPARGAAQLPDDGDRPHRAADRERVAARRGHRRRRGDAHAVRAGAGARTTTAKRPFFVSDALPSADDRRRAHPRRSRCGIEVRRRRRRDVRLRAEQRVFGVLVQYPATDGALLDYRDFVRARARRGRAGRRWRPTCWR